jgi:hypothetical protein
MSATVRLQKSRSCRKNSKGAISLQDEIELMQQKVVNLETLLQTELGLTLDLRHDKKAIQKFELLRLFARTAR